MDGWWCISSESFITALRRAAAGEDPDLVYAEFYANSDHPEVEAEDAEET